VTGTVYDTTKAAVGPWRKASASNGTGSCFEFAPSAGGGVLLRDSKDQGQGPILQFDRSEFEAFLKACNDGKYDDLVS
jgi:hypothetical protein